MARELSDALPLVAVDDSDKWQSFSFSFLRYDQLF